MRALVMDPHPQETPHQCPVCRRGLLFCEEACQPGTQPRCLLRDRRFPNTAFATMRPSVRSPRKAIQWL